MCTDIDGNVNASTPLVSADPMLPIYSIEAPRPGTAQNTALAFLSSRHKIESFTLKGRAAFRAVVYTA